MIKVIPNILTAALNKTDDRKGMPRRQDDDV